MSTAVVYYSASGNGALAAKALAEKESAMLVELREKKKRDFSKVGGSFMAAALGALLKTRPKLMGQPWQDAAACGTLHLIAPVWASRLAPAMNTFVAKYDFKGKTVYLYTVQADPKDTAKPARDALAGRLEKKGAKIAGSRGLIGEGPGKEPRKEIAEDVLKQ